MNFIFTEPEVSFVSRLKINNEKQVGEDVLCIILREMERNKTSKQKNKMRDDVE